MDRYTFDLTALTYQVPSPSKEVGLPVTMIASINPVVLDKVTTDALATGYIAELSAAHLSQAAVDRQSHLNQLRLINTEYREKLSGSVFERQMIAGGCVKAGLSPPASLLNEIFDGLNKLEKPAIDDEFEADIKLASDTVKHTEERAAKAKHQKETLYEQTSLAKEIRLKQRHLGRAVRIGSALTSAVVVGGLTSGFLFKTMQESETRAEKVVRELSEAAQADFAERYDDEDNRSRYIFIGAIGVGVASVSGLTGYTVSRRTATRFARYRARRIVKKTK